MVTSAPWSARALAVAAPMPREPPLTSATLPARALFIGMSPCCTNMIALVHFNLRGTHNSSASKKRISDFACSHSPSHWVESGPPLAGVSTSQTDWVLSLLALFPDRGDQRDGSGPGRPL